MLFSELKCKDVINVRDCKKLGHVCIWSSMSAADVSVRSWCRVETSGWDSCAVSRISSSRIRTSDRLDRT